MKNKIMLMARDPGGANTVIPLVKPLQEKGYQVVLYGKDVALTRYQQLGLAGYDIDEVLPDISIAAWQDFLRGEDPGFIITGTSGDDFSERYLWEAARSRGIGTFAILDQWMNYGIRFSPYSLKEQEEYSRNRCHQYLPDYILVMDDLAKNEMAAEGIDTEQIKVSGQPYFDLIKAMRQEVSQGIDNIKEAVDYQSGELMITYVSEPLSQDYNDINGESYWGFDEKSICRLLLSALEKVTDTPTRPARLVIKQHPRENPDNYNDIVRQFSCKFINIRVEKALDSWPLVLASDLVVGMSSMLLLEAIIMGCPTLCVQAGLKRESPLMLARQGIIDPIMNESDLERSLRNILSNSGDLGMTWEIVPDAVAKVIKYMEELL